MADIIKSSDLVDFDDLLNRIGQVSSALKDLSGSIKKDLKESLNPLQNFKITDSQSIKDFNKDISLTAKATKDAAQAEQAKIKVEQEAEKLRQLKNKSVEKELKQAQQLDSEYKKQSKTLNDLRNQYKDLAIQEKANTDEAKKLLNQITALDAKLKKVDATVGQHQRNVGNYSSAIGELKSSLLNVGAAFGVAFGAGEIISFGKESIGAFLEAEQNANKLSFAVKNIANGSDGAVDRLLEQSAKLQDISIFSDDDIQKAQTQLVQFGLTTKQVEELTPKILDLASAQGIDLTTATDTVIKAINGQTKGLKDVGLNFEDTGSKTENLSVLMDKLGKFSGATGNELETIAGKTKRLENAFDDFKEVVGEFLINEGVKLLDMFDFLFGKTDIIELAFKKLAPVFENLTKSFREGSNEQRKALLENLKTQQLYIQSQISSGNVTDELLKKQKFLLMEIAALNKGANDVLIDEANKNAKILEDNTTKLEEKKKEKIIDTGKELAEEREKRIREENEALLKKYQEEQMLAEINAKQITEIEKNELKEREKSRLAKVELEKKIADEEKAQREKNIKELQGYLTQSLDLIEEEIAKESEAKQKQFDKDISNRQNNIEAQRRLAERGLSNTLAFEERELAKAELAKEQQARKDIQRQKAVTFFKLLASYSEKDPNTALQKAIADTVLADVIAGAFKDGVEDFKGKGTETSDSNLVLLSNRESVITAKGTKENPGLATAMNKGSVDDYFEKEYLPKYAMNLNVPMAKQMSDSASLHQLVNVNKRLESLEKTILNKKETNINLDNLGNVITENIENGFKTIIKNKSKLPRI